MSSELSRLLTLYSQIMFTRKQWITVLSLVVLAAAFRIAIVHYLPSDSTDDSLGYEQIARNLLEHHVYAHVAGPPYTPTIVRTPGYPLFLAAIYSVFGHTNNTAVRIVQALVDTGTCLLVAVLAWLWQPDERRKAATAITALSLAALNPFTTIYAATILSEVPTIFLAMASMVSATIAFRAENSERELRWWTISGLLTGIGVMFRPDSGLFALVIGLLVVIKIFRRGKPSWQHHALAIAVFSVSFGLVLCPWTIRNWRIFHIVQPLAPFHANMPGEFFPSGYERWLKTWVVDQELTDEVWWEIDQQQIDVDELPDSAFDSQAERDLVAELFDRYNNAGAHTQEVENSSREPGISPSPPKAAVDNTKQNGSDAKRDASEDSDDDEQNNSAPSGQPPKPGQMTPEIDAAFGQIASERIARHPLRYYVVLPAKRAHALWFDTHSDHYPFEGTLLPLEDLDHQSHQQIWLPLFAILVGIYTITGVLGVVALINHPKTYARVGAFIIILIIVTRLVLMSAVVSVEPRYVLVFFPFLSAMGGIAIVNLLGRVGVERSA